MRQHNFNEFSANQKACYEMLSEWAGGDHHLPTVHQFGDGVCINYHGDLYGLHAARNNLGRM